MKVLSSNAGTLRIDKSGLEAMRKHIKSLEASHIKLGVFDARNAYIGFIHEYGCPAKNIPMRSFLRFPIIRRLRERVTQFTPKAWADQLHKGVEKFLGLVAICAEGSIQDGFQTGGFGQWPALKPATIQKKGSSAILIDTAQLRQAVTSQVVVV